MAVRPGIFKSGETYSTPYSLPPRLPQWLDILFSSYMDRPDALQTNLKTMKTPQPTFKMGKPSNHTLKTMETLQSTFKMEEPSNYTLKTWKPSKLIPKTGRAV